MQGWEGTWTDGSHNRGWVLNQKSLTGRQIQAILDKSPELKGKTIVEYPDRMCAFFLDTLFCFTYWN